MFHNCLGMFTLGKLEFEPLLNELEQSTLSVNIIWSNNPQYWSSFVPAMKHTWNDWLNSAW